MMSIFWLLKRKHLIQKKKKFYAIFNESTLFNNIMKIK